MRRRCWDQRAHSLPQFLTHFPRVGSGQWFLCYFFPAILPRFYRFSDKFLVGQSSLHVAVGPEWKSPGLPCPQGVSLHFTDQWKLVSPLNLAAWLAQHGPHAQTAPGYFALADYFEAVFLVERHVRFVHGLKVAWKATGVSPC